jgi:hypothetical protein
MINYSNHLSGTGAVGRELLGTEGVLWRRTFYNAFTQV